MTTFQAATEVASSKRSEHLSPGAARSVPRNQRDISRESLTTRRYHPTVFKCHVAERQGKGMVLAWGAHEVEAGGLDSVSGPALLEVSPTHLQISVSSYKNKVLNSISEGLLASEMPEQMVC